MFVDGANLYATVKTLGYEIDFSLFLKAFNKDGSLLRAYYYTATVEDGGGMVTIRPLIDWLEFNGYTVVHKPAKTFIDKTTGLSKVKGNMDIEIAIDCMEIADHVTHVVIFSGDGDFTRLVRAVQRKGVHVTVVSTIETHPPMIADELRRAADIFVDLNNVIIKSRISRARTPDRQ